MERYPDKDEKCLQLLNLIRNEIKECVEKKEAKSYGVSEEEKLELRLGPPDGNWSIKDSSFVGWPPIHSLRKNLASISSQKLSSEPQCVVQNKAVKENPTESCEKRLFVKINMDGVPIGRKVDLKACDSYKKLSYAVDELFSGLLAAQNGHFVAENGQKEEGDKVFSSLLDGRGEYALVYEDNEGDKMLVKDVQWQVFISTVKRLRVLKSSELSTLNCRKQMKL